ncbi:MAG: transglutaminase family protein [Clostridia bacterium]|nr:transglutaminase family protein [Clostridia bacterium]
MSKYVPYHEPSIRKAKDLCKNCAFNIDKYSAITKWINHNIVYDFIRAKNIPKKGALPDVAGCWEKHMGICQDIAALTVGMLRAVGVYCVLAIGRADGFYHAWVEATINGKLYRFDRSGKAKTYKREKSY